MDTIGYLNSDIGSFFYLKLLGQASWMMASVDLLGEIQ